MDAVTYPNTDIQLRITKSFVPVKLEIEQHGKSAHEYGVLWTPGLLCLDTNGAIIARTEGYYPPQEFSVLLTLMEGRWALYSKNYDQAWQHFDRIVRESPGSTQAAEALFYKGVADYRKTGAPDGLRQIWTELRDRYPNSLFHQHSSFIFS